jgi:predicted nucleotidyltransferase
MPFEISETAQKKLLEVCRRYYVRKLSIFGSTLHGDAREDSDIDILIEFLPGHAIGLFAFAGIERELSAILGRKVDLRTAEDLSRYFREDVVKEAQSLYAAR